MKLPHFPEGRQVWWKTLESPFLQGGAEWGLRVLAPVIPDIL